MNATAIAFNYAKPVNIWPQPDMSVLLGGRRAPPQMPGEMFGTSWSLVQHLAEGAGAPVDYVAFGFIATATSLIGGKRRVRPFSTSNWAEPAVLWCAAVGDPSSNKRRLSMLRHRRFGRWRPTMPRIMPLR